MDADVDERIPVNGQGWCKRRVGDVEDGWMDGRNGINGNWWLMDKYDITQPKIALLPILFAVSVCLSVSGCVCVCSL